ncbi:MAG: helix-turn-helix transcriptional regulator [Clostridia bacterium]|nr:helix-turn-helix transcriptional regulator [Clostridia bacterium]
MNILERINELRNNLGWSLYKLSEESGVSQSTLSNMFVRRTNPNIATLSMICDALGITLSDFFADTGSTFSSEELLLLSNFRKLDKKEKNIVLSLIDTILKQK